MTSSEDPPADMDIARDTPFVTKSRQPSEISSEPPTRPPSHPSLSLVSPFNDEMTTLLYDRHLKMPCMSLRSFGTLTFAQRHLLGNGVEHSKHQLKPLSELSLEWLGADYEGDGLMFLRAPFMLINDFNNRLSTLTMPHLSNG